MGFYLRKSVKVGLFRLNLSKRGIGVSTGIRGLRLGTGPRGTYVHMGRGGLYYRKYFSQSGPRDSGRLETSPDGAITPDGEAVPIEQLPLIDAPADSDPLINEIESKRKERRYFPFVFLSCVVIVIWLLSSRVNGSIVTAFAVAALIGCGATRANDAQRCTPVFLFDLDADIELVFSKVCDVFAELSHSGALWAVKSQSAGDWKRNAGATALVDRQRTIVGHGAPPGLRTNIDVPYIPCAFQTLYFFPSSVVIAVGNRVTRAVKYSDLHCTVDTINFREDGSVPPGAEIIGQTWLKVNRDGSRDRRFANNRQIPIVRYGVVRFSNSEGWSIELESSSLEAVNKIPVALKLLTFTQATAPNPATQPQNGAVTITLTLNGPTDKITTALASLAEAMRRELSERQHKYDDAMTSCDAAYNPTSTGWLEKHLSDAQTLLSEIAVGTNGFFDLRCLGATVCGLPGCGNSGRERNKRLRR